MNWIFIYECLRQCTTTNSTPSRSLWLVMDLMELNKLNWIVLYTAQHGCGDHTASYSMKTTVLFPGVQQAWCSPSSNAEGKNRRIFTFALPVRLNSLDTANVAFNCLWFVIFLLYKIPRVCNTAAEKHKGTGNGHIERSAWHVVWRKTSNLNSHSNGGLVLYQKG